MTLEQSRSITVIIFDLFNITAILGLLDVLLRVVFLDMYFQMAFPNMVWGTHIEWNNLVDFILYLVLTKTTYLALS